MHLVGYLYVEVDNRLNGHGNETQLLSGEQILFSSVQTGSEEVPNLLPNRSQASFRGGKVGEHVDEHSSPPSAHNYKEIHLHFHIVLHHVLINQKNCLYLYLI